MLAFGDQFPDIAFVWFGFVCNAGVLLGHGIEGVGIQYDVNFKGNC
jgi:hypothetical protein